MYEGYLLYFRIREQWKISIIESKPKYSLFYEFAPIFEVLLPLWLRYLHRHPSLIPSERSNDLFRCRNTLTLSIFFTHGNKKKSFGDKLELNGRLLIRAMRLCVVKNTFLYVVAWELALLRWRVSGLLLGSTSSA